MIGDACGISFSYVIKLREMLQEVSAILSGALALLISSDYKPEKLTLPSPEFLRDIKLSTFHESKTIHILLC